MPVRRRIDSQTKFRLLTPTGRLRRPIFLWKIVEPATLGLEGRCSIHMSYRRFVLFGSGDSERFQISNYHLSRSVNAGATQDRFANEVSSAHPYGAPSASNLPLEDCRTCYPRLRRPMLYPYELQALRPFRSDCGDPSNVIISQRT